MKVDFRKIKVVDLIGNTEEIDISKVFGNEIFKNANDIGEFDKAREMYHNGEVELTPDIARRLKVYVKCFERIIMQDAIMNELDKVINEEKQE